MTDHVIFQFFFRRDPCFDQPSPVNLNRQSLKLFLFIADAIDIAFTFDRSYRVIVVI